MKCNHLDSDCVGCGWVKTCETHKAMLVRELMDAVDDWFVADADVASSGWSSASESQWEGAKHRMMLAVSKLKEIKI